METVRIIHRHEPGYGWSFDSPDLAGLVGGDDTYEASVRRAEKAVRFHLDSLAAERGQRSPSDVTIEHFVPAGRAAPVPDS